MLTYLYFLYPEYTLFGNCSFAVGKTQVPFSMAIGNEELMQKCFPKPSSKGSARMK